MSNYYEEALRGIDWSGTNSATSGTILTSTGDAGMTWTNYPINYGEQYIHHQNNTVGMRDYMANYEGEGLCINEEDTDLKRRKVLLLL